MSTPTNIRDADEGTAAKVTSGGVLVVGSLSHSTPYYISVAAATVEYQVIEGKAKKSFIVTGLLLASSKTFGSATTAETLTIYEASPADITVSEKTIVQLDMLKNDRFVATGLDLLVSNAKSLIAIATDSSVDVTISGYYIDA